MAFTHHLEDLTEHSFFSQRRSQQMFSTTIPQAKYPLVIKRVTYGNTPSHFPYFLPSSVRKNRVRKLRNSDIPRLLLANGQNCSSLLLSVVFHKLSATVLPIVYVYMKKVSEL